MIGATLEHLVLEIDGCRAAMVVGQDGIAVEWIVVDEIIEPEGLAAGLGDLFNRAVNTMLDSSLGSAEQIEIRSRHATCIVRPSGPGYFLAALLAPEADLDVGRDELRRAAAALAADLGEVFPGETVTIRDSASS